MPIVNVRTPGSAFEGERRQRIVSELTDAIAAAEQIPDDPSKRARIIIIWEELPATAIYVNGSDISQVAVPVFVDMQPPAGALDEDHAPGFVAAVERIFTSNGPDDGRAVTTSVVITPVLDGSWGISGRISRLPDFARTAGYRHLAHLVG
jgi:phenylpyruvate tautomerase PptA (4-oxalocrotonate tautomerase family)